MRLVYLVHEWLVCEPENGDVLHDPTAQLGGCFGSRLDSLAGRCRRPMRCGGDSSYALLRTGSCAGSGVLPFGVIPVYGTSAGFALKCGSGESGTRAVDRVIPGQGPSSSPIAARVPREPEQLNEGRCHGASQNKDGP